MQEEVVTQESKDSLSIKLVADKNQQLTKELEKSITAFANRLEPVEAQSGQLLVFVDKRTGAHYCECHVKASKFVPASTIDVALDPEESPEYRANRELVENHVAFERMKTDAAQSRSFSNIVTEFNPEQNADGH